MIDLFQALNEEETSLLMDAIPMVTLLIAGADGQIDKREKDWGAKLTKIRSYSHQELLNEYYAEVGLNFADRLDAMISEFPSDTDQRTALISEKLAQLNPILAKLDPSGAYVVYKSFTSFAEHVAKASGGFLRMGAINPAEKKLISLPMLTAIELPEEDEEA